MNDDLTPDDILLQRLNGVPVVHNGGTKGIDIVYRAVQHFGAEKVHEAARRITDEERQQVVMALLQGLDDDQSSSHL